MGIRKSDNAAQILCNAIKRHNTVVEFEANGEIEQIFSEAYRIDPRIIGWVDSWEGTKKTAGMFRRYYSIMIRYVDGIADDIDKVILDDGEWELSKALSQSACFPERIYIVTNDVEKFCRRLQQDMGRLKTKGLSIPVLQTKINKESINGYHSIIIELEQNRPRDQRKPIQNVTKELCLQIDELLDRISEMRKKAEVVLCNLNKEENSSSTDYKENDETVPTGIEKPYEGDEAFIFVSYAHKNIQDVLPVIRHLQSHGYRIWYDEGIDPGTEWDENIAAHINKCHCVVAFISPEYVESDNCCDELNYARDLKKNRLLIYLSEVELPPGMAMRLNRIQAIFMYKYEYSGMFYEKLIGCKIISECIIHEFSK